MLSWSITFSLISRICYLLLSSSSCPWWCWYTYWETCTHSCPEVGVYGSNGEGKTTKQLCVSCRSKSPRRTSVRHGCQEEGSPWPVVRNGSASQNSGEIHWNRPPASSLNHCQCSRGSAINHEGLELLSVKDGLGRYVVTLWINCKGHGDEGAPLCEGDCPFVCHTLGGHYFVWCLNWL